MLTVCHNLSKFCLCICKHKLFIIVSSSYTTNLEPSFPSRHQSMLISKVWPCPHWNSYGVFHCMAIPCVTSSAWCRWTFRSGCFKMNHDVTATAVLWDGSLWGGYTVLSIPLILSHEFWRWLLNYRQLLTHSLFNVTAVWSQNDGQLLQYQLWTIILRSSNCSIQFWCWLTVCTKII